MHVLYHHRTAGDRVEGVHIMGMVRALRRLGHTVEICGPPGCSPERKGTVARIAGAPVARSALRIRLKRLAQTAPPLLFELAELGYNVYSFLDMARRGRRQEPDLIYERTTSNSVAPTLLALYWKIPIVQEVNVTADIGRLRPLILGALARRIERWAISRTTLIVAVSEAFKQLLVKGGLPADKILVCQNAVDLDAFDPAVVNSVKRPEQIGEDSLVIGYVGSFAAWHRVDMLVNVADELAQRHLQARWLLVGDGIERPGIERLLAEFRLAEEFWMPGAVAHQLVPSYIMAMDVGVMPHSNVFGSPMKIFEYMAMGKAVVAPRVPAIEEVLSHGETGLLFAPGDVGSLQVALERVICDPELRDRLGRNAREYVMRHHTWTKNAKCVLDLLDSHMERRREAE